MIELILMGVVTGLTLSLSLGIVFFSLIQNSVEYGPRSGVFIALGVTVSDLIFLFFVLYGAQYVPAIAHADIYINVFGGIMLIAVGLYNIQKKSHIEYPETQRGSAWYFFGNGFVLNVVNPANFFIWATMITKLKADNYDTSELYVFLLSCLVAIFLSEIAVSFFASKLKRFFTDQKLKYINRIAGIAFIIFGFVMFWQGYKVYIS